MTGKICGSDEERVKYYQEENEKLKVELEELKVIAIKYKARSDYIRSLNSCMDCKASHSCEWCPKPGLPVRINCIYWTKYEEIQNENNKTLY